MTPDQIAALIRELIGLRALARSERDMLGDVRPLTLIRIHETCAKVEAVLAIDDARLGKRVSK